MFTFLYPRKRIFTCMCTLRYFHDVLPRVWQRATPPHYGWRAPLLLFTMWINISLIDVAIRLKIAAVLCCLAVHATFGRYPGSAPFGGSGLSNGLPVVSGLVLPAEAFFVDVHLSCLPTQVVAPHPHIPGRQAPYFLVHPEQREPWRPFGGAGGSRAAAAVPPENRWGAVSFSLFPPRPIGKANWNSLDPVFLIFTTSGPSRFLRC